MVALATTEPEPARFLLEDVDNVPVVRLRDYLTQAKLEHRDFDSAWAFARLRAVHGLGKFDKAQWLTVLDETQHEWRACYTNTQTTIPRLKALQLLATP